MMMRDVKSPKVQKLILRNGEIFNVDLISFRWKTNVISGLALKILYGYRLVCVCVCVRVASSGDKYVVQLGYPPLHSGLEIKFGLEEKKLGAFSFSCQREIMMSAVESEILILFFVFKVKIL